MRVYALVCLHVCILSYCKLPSPLIFSLFFCLFFFFFLFSSPQAHATAKALTQICGLGIWMSQVNRTFS